MTIAVLGASGRLARILRAFCPDKADIRWIGRELYAPDGARHLEGAGAVLDLAGVVPRRGDLSTNLELSRKALKAARAAGAGRVHFASTAAVYGRGPGFDETSTLKPAKGYGVVKAACEEHALQFDHPTSILRIGNVAGADAILGDWTDGQRLEIFPAGHAPRRSYIGPVSLARVLLALCDEPDLPDVINVAAPGVVGMDDLLTAANLRWTPVDAPDTAIAEVRLKTDRLTRLVSFTPEESTAEGLVAQWRLWQEAGS